VRQEGIVSCDMCYLKLLNISWLNIFTGLGGSDNRAIAS
jgi:hypothetical protein